MLVTGTLYIDQKQKPCYIELKQKQQDNIYQEYFVTVIKELPSDKKQRVTFPPPCVIDLGLCKSKKVAGRWNITH